MFTRQQLLLYILVPVFLSKWPSTNENNYGQEWKEWHGTGLNWWHDKAFIFFFLLFLPHSFQRKTRTPSPTCVLYGVCSSSLCSAQSVGDMAWWLHLILPSTLKLKRVAWNKHLEKGTKDHAVSNAKLSLIFAHCLLYPRALHGGVTNEAQSLEAGWKVGHSVNLELNQQYINMSNEACTNISGLLNRALIRTLWYNYEKSYLETSFHHCLLLF